MSVALFNYTLLMLLLSVLSSALCLASFLVSRKKSLGFASIGFFLYFLDMAWIFQDAFIVFHADGSSLALYETVRTATSLITGIGCLSAFWLVVCDYLDENRQNVRITPMIVFFILSALTLVLLPNDSLGRFVFYTWRMVFVAFMLIFIAFRFLKSTDEIDKVRFRKHRITYALIWLFAIAVVVEDIICFLIASEPPLAILNQLGIPERNYAENALMVCCMATAIFSSYKVLAIRFDERPKSAEGGTTDKQEEIIRDTLPRFGKRYGLTERERQVLHLVLQGKTNQEIATQEHLALSTVKVHVHNILQKTESPNRQELIKDFWKF